MKPKRSDLVPVGSHSVPTDLVPVPSPLKVATRTGEPGPSHKRNHVIGTESGTKSGESDDQGEMGKAIHRLLLKGELVQVNKIDPATGEYLIWTPAKAKEAGLKIVPYDPARHDPTVS